MRKRKTRLRIIGGRFGGQSLMVNASQALRPTTDKTRETLFNWLMHDISGAHCLDLFAGSGALGIEALSRGAQHTTFVDHHSPVCRQIRQTIEQFKCDNVQVIQAEIPNQLERIQGSFDIVFIDPPFHQSLLLPTTHALDSSGLIHDGSLVYLEFERNLTLENLPETWQQLKSGKAGDCCYQLYVVQKN